jgi:hypothetical protein
MLPPGKPWPELSLLPKPGPVYVAYGKPASFYLGPCASGTRNTSCGAVAWDVRAANNARLSDLTRFIAVEQAVQCSQGAQVTVRAATLCCRGVVRSMHTTSLQPINALAHCCSCACRTVRAAT